MSFGPIMQVQTDSGLSIELAPFTREEALQFVPSFQKMSTTRFLHTHVAQTAETEQEWYDKVIHDSASYVWGIWVREGAARKLIGNTVIESIEGTNFRRGTTGSVILDEAYRNRGIASATHKARAWFAFRHIGINRLLSYIYEGNEASMRAIIKTGYVIHHVTRNELFYDGEWRAVNVMECLNPDDLAWRQWWANDRPPRKNVEARARTQAALEWAQTHVTLL